MEIQVKLTDGAFIPTKAHPEDTGYDLTLISLVKDMSFVKDMAIDSSERSSSECIFMFDTGVAVKPPIGYYIDVVPRSSFSKTGYSFSNCVGVIDSTYRGTIRIVLKGDSSLRDLKLPYKGFQMILRKFEYSCIRQVDSLQNTVRECEGFGSSDPDVLPQGC